VGVFLYYLPGLPFGDCTLDRLRESPLSVPLRDCLESSSAFGRTLAIRAVHANGPDGMSGTLVCAGARDSQPVGMYPARQKWEQWGAVWIGRDTEDPPQPIDLQRPQMLSGYERELGGIVWTVPVVRRGGMRPALPQSMARTPAGEFELRLRDEWREPWEQSGKIWDQIVDPKPCPFAEVFDLCCSMLSLNYRVGPAELSILGTVDTTNWQTIYECVADWPTVAEMLGEPDPNAPAPVPAGEAGVANSMPGAAA